MPKLFFYDLETTGTDPKRHSIHQISGVIEIGVGLLQPFNLKIQPNPYAEIDDEALKIGGITREDLARYMPFVEGYQWLIQLLSTFVDKFDKKDKFFLVGYCNGKFDDFFLRAFFEQNHDKYFGSWFWGTSIDIASLATDHLMNKRAQMDNFKLATVAKQLGIQVDDSKLHDAMYDIKLSRLVYYEIKRLNKY